MGCCDAEKSPCDAEKSPCDAEKSPCDAEKSPATKEAMPSSCQPEWNTSKMVEKIDCTKVFDHPCHNCDICQEEGVQLPSVHDEPDKSDATQEATVTSRLPEQGQKTTPMVVQTEDKKHTNRPRCDCEICRHEAKMRTLVNIEPPTDANRYITTYQISYGKGHPQYRSLMAALSGAPAEDDGGLGPEPLYYRLARTLCPSVDPEQATCHPYIPSVCPGPVYERHGPFPGLTEFQDTISSNAMRLWLSSQQIRAARPPTCVCSPDPKTGSQPICCQAHDKPAVAC